MKKQMHWLENILKKKIKNLVTIFLIYFFLLPSVYATEKWVIDKNLSSIKFELPVLFASNVTGEFKNIDGLVEIDLKNKKNNKAILSVEIKSVEGNYKKYRELLLGPIFFDSSNYPIAVLDTKKFSYENETNLTLSIELTIRGTSKIVDTNLIIKRLTNDIVQILGSLEFSRTDFGIGIGSWANTTILKENILIESNIFLIKE
tara:strand:- start:69 stop:677 length:609 start_codon:yes stop_codon:yes gene_type:complete